jgi:hypothetical protein
MQHIMLFEDFRSDSNDSVKVDWFLNEMKIRLFNPHNKNIMFDIDSTIDKVDREVKNDDLKSIMYVYLSLSVLFAINVVPHFVNESSWKNWLIGLAMLGGAAFTNSADAQRFPHTKYGKDFADKYTHKMEEVGNTVFKAGVKTLAKISNKTHAGEHGLKAVHFAQKQLNKIDPKAHDLTGGYDAKIIKTCLDHAKKIHQHPISQGVEKASNKLLNAGGEIISDSYDKLKDYADH